MKPKHNPLAEILKAPRDTSRAGVVARLHRMEPDSTVRQFFEDAFPDAEDLAWVLDRSEDGTLGDIFRAAIQRKIAEWPGSAMYWRTRGGKQ